jgi:hypothetical protein
VTSPDLSRMAARAALPIHMECHRISRAGHFRFMCSSPQHPAGLWSYSPQQATFNYLRLVASLESAGPSPAVSSDGCSAPASPGGES